jgi:BASS family bile acid:Na+ symporter
MLLPLAAALIVKARFPAAADRAKPPLDKISTLSLILVIVLIVVLNFKSMLSVLGTGGILAAILFVAAGYGLGWLLGGPAADTRSGLGLGTAQRNVAAAFVVGSQSFTDPKVVVMVVVGAIVALVILLPLSRILSKRS